MSCSKSFKKSWCMRRGKVFIPGNIFAKHRCGVDKERGEMRKNSISVKDKKCWWLPC